MLSEKLEHFEIAAAPLSGTIVNALYKLGALQELELDNTKLSGALLPFHASTCPPPHLFTTPLPRFHVPPPPTSSLLLSHASTPLPHTHLFTTTLPHLDVPPTPTPLHGRMSQRHCHLAI